MGVLTSGKKYVYPEPSDINNLGPIDFVVHETPGYYLDLASITVDTKIRLLSAEGNREGHAGWKSYFKSIVMVDYKSISE